MRMIKYATNLLSELNSLAFSHRLAVPEMPKAVACSICTVWSKGPLDKN